MADYSFDPGKRIYSICSDIVIEEFEGGALLLWIEERCLSELNPTAHYILTQTNGQRNAARVAASLAATFDIAEQEALQDTLSFYEQFSDQGVVEIIEARQVNPANRAGEEVPIPSPVYIRNPDVTLGKEDHNGGILFNPDNNQLKMLNTTALFIWKACDGTRDLTGIISAMQAAFDDISEERVFQDVWGFTEELAQCGFIDIVDALRVRDSTREVIGVR